MTYKFTMHLTRCAEPRDLEPLALNFEEMAARELAKPTKTRRAHAAAAAEAHVWKMAAEMLRHVTIQIE